MKVTDWIISSCTYMAVLDKTFPVKHGNKFSISFIHDEIHYDLEVGNVNYENHYHLIENGIDALYVELVNEVSCNIHYIVNLERLGDLV